MTNLPPIFRLILIPAVLLAIWLCPCAAAHAREHRQVESSHSCCKTSQEQPPGNPHDQHDCPHCSGQQNLTLEKSKAPAFSPELSAGLSLPDSLSLVSTLEQSIVSPRMQTAPAAHSPPIRLQTCTFLF